MAKTKGKNKGGECCPKPYIIKEIQGLMGSGTQVAPQAFFELLDNGDRELLDDGSYELLD